MPPRRSWLFAGCVWLVSRTLFFAVGAAGHLWVREADVLVSRPPPGTLSYWANWDGALFSQIARYGYENDQQTSFFPLFPLLMRALAWTGLGIPLAGIVLSSVASFFAFLFLYELARWLADERAARLATVGLAVFPTAFFMNAAYSESVFLALTAASLWALYVLRDPLNAGLIGYFAALTRSFGVFLVIPLAWEWLRARREYGRLGLVGVLAPLVGLGTYCFYLWRVARRPLLFNAAYEKWGRRPTDPLTTLVRAARYADDGLGYLFHPRRVLGTSSLNPPFTLANTVAFGIAVVLLALLALSIGRLPLGLFGYAAAMAIAPMLVPLPTAPLIGLPRYALAPLPLFVVLSALLVRSRVGAAVWFLASGALAIYLTLEFVTFRWVA